FIRNMRDALEEKEMTVVNIAVDRAHLWDPDPEVRARLKESALGYLRLAEMLGCRTVRIDTGRAEEMNEEQFEYIVTTYREYAKRAYDMGYVVGPENHMGASLDPLAMKAIAEAVDHPGFGILLHMNRWKANADIGDRLVAPWVMHTHF